LSNGGKFFDQVLDVGGDVSCVGGECSVTPVGLSLVEGDSYRWWVQAQNSAGAAGWSSSLDFEIETSAVVPGQVTLVAPTGGDVLASPEFVWVEDVDASEYRLWVQSSGGGVVHDVVHLAPGDVVCTVGECSITPVGLSLPDDSYQWWVQGQSAAGNGLWSSSLSFVVGGSSPGAATLLAPTGAGVGTSPTYTWDTVAAATWYYVWVNDDAGSATVSGWFNAAQAGCGGGELTCSVTPSTAVSGAGTFWVLTWNPAGFGPWSTPLTFNTN